MCPGSDLLTALNSATANATAASDYYAVQSTFTALNGMLNAVMNTAVDRLFHGKENNLSVPALGVSDIDRNLLAQRYVLYSRSPPKKDHVFHTGYVDRETPGKQAIMRLLVLQCGRCRQSCVE